MKIALKIIGAERWVAGIYYISNLVRALKSLPEQESPQILLVRSADTAYEDHSELDGMVEWFPPMVFEKKLKIRTSISRGVLRIASNNSMLFRLFQWINAYTKEKRSRVLLYKLNRQNVSLLFPCLVSVGPRSPVPWLPWIWDLQHKHYPNLFSNWEKRRRDRTFGRIARDAHIIVVSSKNAREDFQTFYPDSAGKVRVLQFRVYPDASWYNSNPRSICARYDLPPRFLMLSNQFFPHKNHFAVFQAIKILSDRKTDVSLVCTGSTRDGVGSLKNYEFLQRYISSNGLSGRIRILGLIPRDEQIQIMREALAVVQPSLFEGWSTVVEDARALGKRLYVSDIPVHREQDHPSAAYFDPHSPKMLADVIVKEWASLDPGKNRADEERARRKQMELIGEYARSFMTIAEELVDNASV